MFGNYTQYYWDGATGLRKTPNIYLLIPWKLTFVFNRSRFFFYFRQLLYWWIKNVKVYNVKVVLSKQIDNNFWKSHHVAPKKFFYSLHFCSLSAAVNFMKIFFFRFSQHAFKRQSHQTTEIKQCNEKKSACPKRINITRLKLHTFIISL